MRELAVPIYDIAEGCHRFSFPDATHLEILRPQQDAMGRLWAEVVAKHGADRVFNRARFDLLDLEARLRFHAAAARRGDHRLGSPAAVCPRTCAAHPPGV